VSKTGSTTRRTRMFISCIKGDFLISYTNFKRFFSQWSRDSVVDILTGIMGSGIRGFNPGAGKNTINVDVYDTA
jgi:hypothetical protein